MNALAFIQHTLGLDLATLLAVAPALIMASIFALANVLHFLAFGEWMA